MRQDARQAHARKPQQRQQSNAAPAATAACRRPTGSRDASKRQNWRPNFPLAFVQVNV